MVRGHSSVRFATQGSKVAHCNEKKRERKREAEEKESVTNRRKRVIRLKRK
jgi:hypothetical protein